MWETQKRVSRDEVDRKEAPQVGTERLAHVDAKRFPHVGTDMIAKALHLSNGEEDLQSVGDVMKASYWCPI